MDPPIHVECNRVGGAEIRIFISLGACLRTSASKRSPKPGNNVDPPDKMICEKSVLRRSMSDFMIAWTSDSWTPISRHTIKYACGKSGCIPLHSDPISSGRKSTSGARNFSAPIYQSAVRIALTDLNGLTFKSVPSGR